MTDTALDDAVQELLVLWPALPTALPRDAGTQSGERVATSENVHTVPINVDVAAVITDLTRAIPDWARWAAEQAGQGRNDHADIRVHLQRLPGLYDALSAHGRTRDAQRLHDTVHAWLTRCRRALGLDLPDRPTGMRCPNHDDPLTALVQPGDHGQLRYAKLDTHGRPVDPQVTWQRVEVVLCRHCDAMWPPARYMWLGRLIKDADARRATPEPSDAA